MKIFGIGTDIANISRIKKSLKNQKLVARLYHKSEIQKCKKHHKQEVKKQYFQNKNWIEPYYIERFYDIADEYMANEVGYNLKIIAMHMDALYENSDNYKLPIMEALRIVSLIQDGESKRANLILLRAQKKYNNQ